MAIAGRSPKECFERYQEHISKLISDTIGLRVPVRCFHKYGTNQATLAFYEMQAGTGKSQPCTIAIETAHGKLYFYLAQHLEADPRGKEFVLRTKQYWYRIQATPGYRDQALIRWEFVKKPADEHCRHHAQIGGAIKFGNGMLDLNDAHLATGYVFIEFVLRFLIADLKVKPKAGWSDALKASEATIFREFVPGSATK